MSTTIDQKVVEMRFDNRQFEANAKQSISTLDKLKQSLNFKGTSNGLETIGAAAENIRTKFSALDVVAVTTLANITNSAVNTGKQLVKSLSVDQIMSGWNKYAEKTANVQTIMNATGLSIEEVNEYLDKLMWFSDETSYGFTDMTKALATMTSSGGDIKKLIPLITGVANATAFAGKGAGEFSRVLQYGINQAYSLGYMQVQDWKTIEGATVNSRQLIQALITAGELLGKIEKGSVTAQNFRNSLKDKWLDTEVLETGFGMFSEFSDAVHDAVASGEYETASDAIEALSVNFDELGVKAFKSAQEAKTFQEAIDATKDAVSSGWMRTFEIIFGTYDKAKELWTGVANFLWDVFASGSEDRNAYLEEVLSFSPWEALKEKLDNGTIGKIAETAKELSKLTDKIEYYRDIVNKVWRGNYGNQPVREGLLEKDGYNFDIVQYLVNKTIKTKGYTNGNKPTAELIAEAYKHAGVSMEEAAKSTQNLDTALENLNDDQLIALGFAEEEVGMLRDLQKEAKRLDKPIEELLANMEDMDTRALLIDSVKNAGDGLLGIITALKDAWNEAFPPMSAVRIYTLVDAINKFSEKLRFTDKETGELTETGSKLTRIIKGAVALVDVLTTLLGGPVKIAFKVISKILEAFDLDILDVIAGIADAIVAFRDWIDSIIDFDSIADNLVSTMEKLNVIETVKAWFKSAKGLFKAKVAEFKIFGENIISGLTNGLKGGASKVWNAIVEMAKGLIHRFSDVLGIESPSKAFIALGGFIIAGLIAGLTGGFGDIGDTVEGMTSKLTDAFGNIDWSIFTSLLTNLAKLPGLGWLSTLSGLAGLFSIFGKDTFAGFANGLLAGAKNVFEVISSIAQSVITKFCEIFGIESPSKVFFALGGFIIAGLIGGILNGEGSVKEALAGIGNAFINFFKDLDLGTIIAGGAGIGALLLFKEVLEIVDKFGDAAAGIGKFASSMGSLAKVVEKDGIEGLLNGKSTKVSKFASIAKSILTIAGAIAILAGVVIIFTKIDPKSLWGAIGAVTVLSGVMIGLIAAVNAIQGAKNIDTIGPMLIKVAGAMAVMALVAKILGSMDPSELWQGVGAITAFALIIVALMYATKLINGTKNVDKIGSTLIKIAGAMAIMTLVAKIAGSMDPEKLGIGIAAILAFALIISGLMFVTKVLNGSKNVDKIGSTLLKISGAILIMLAVAKLASMMSPEDLNKGYAAIIAFSGIIVGLMRATKLIAGNNKNVDAIGSTIFKIAGAMAIMILVAKIAASMSPQEMVQGIAAIVAFGGIVVGLMWATKLIGDSKNVEKIGIAILSVSGAIAAMVIAAKIAATMSPSELAKGLIAVVAFSAIIVGLMAAVKLIGGSEGADKLGKTILMIGASIAIMAVAVALLSLIEPKRLAGATVALSIIMGMFALVVKAASNMKSAIASLIVITVAIGVLSFILYKLSELPVESTLGTAAALSILLLSLAGSLAILSLMKTVPWAAIGAIALMGLVVAELGLILGVMSHFNVGVSLETVAGISALLLVMTGVLAALALMGPMASTAFVGIGALAVLGLVVGELAIILGLMAHFDVNPSIETAGALSILLISMSAALVLLGVVGLMGPAAFIGIGALATLIAGIGGLLVAIGALVTKFPQLEEFLNVGVPILEKIGYALGSFFGNIVSGFMDGALDFIPELGAKLSEFMTNAQPFIDGAKSIDPTVMEGVKSLAEAVLILTGANLIEGIGRFLGFGDSSLANFGSQLGSLGTNLATFVTNLGTFTEEQVTTVDCAGKAIKALADAAGEIPADGGWIAALFGDNSISTFGSKLPQLGTDLKNFVTNLGTFTEEQVTTVDCAGKAIKALAEAAKDIPNDGGVWGWLAGENSISTFGSKLPQLGTDLAGFVTNLGTFSDGQVSTVKSAVSAINALANLSGEGTDVSKISDLGKKLNTFAKKIGEFATKMSEISADSLTSATDKLKALISTINDISSSNTEAAEQFAKALKTLGQNGVEKFVEAFTTDATTSKVKSAAKAMLDNFISGLKSKNEDVKDTGEAVGKKATSGMGSKSVTDAAKSAGEDLVDGFAAGISDNTYKAEAQAAAMAEAAYEAAKEELDVNSPSKIFRSLGYSIPEGLAMGIDRLSRLVTNSSVEMADSAIDNVKSSISRISDVINSDIDTQPTIRPVLDLSDVRSGASTIGSMFDSRATVGVSGNINAISAMMNNNQNGANSDVVSAINKLRKDLGNVGGTQYNINGVTYDDGTNVSSAVQSLVRAVKIERRI